MDAREAAFIVQVAINKLVEAAAKVLYDAEVSGDYVAINFGSNDTSIVGIHSDGTVFYMPVAPTGPIQDRLAPFHEPVGVMATRNPVGTPCGCCKGKGTV